MSIGIVERYGYGAMSNGCSLLGEKTRPCKMQRNEHGQWVPTTYRESEILQGEGDFAHSTTEP